MRAPIVRLRAISASRRAGPAGRAMVSATTPVWSDPWIEDGPAGGSQPGMQHLGEVVPARFRESERAGDIDAATECTR